jgi:hypothetical protein
VSEERVRRVALALLRFDQRTHGHPESGDLESVIDAGWYLALAEVALCEADREAA